MTKLRCKLRGHKLISLAKENQKTKEYQCQCCQKKFTEDGYGKIVKLTKYWENNNLLFEKYFQNKTAL